MQERLKHFFLKLVMKFTFSVVSSKKREIVPDLAPLLWNSFGTIAALLQEIIQIYPCILPPVLTVSNFYWPLLWFITHIGKVNSCDLSIASSWLTSLLYAIQCHLIHQIVQPNFQSFVMISLHVLFPQASQSNRVCNALALLQCVASHPDTRSVFLSGNMIILNIRVHLFFFLITVRSQIFESYKKNFFFFLISPKPI